MMKRMGLSLISMLIGCTPSEASCVVGRVEICPCPSGGIGSQTCLGDNTFGACLCPMSDAGTPVDVSDPMDAGFDDSPTPVDAPRDAGRPGGHVVLFGHPTLGDENQARAIVNAIFLGASGSTNVRILEFDDPVSAWRMYMHDDISPEAIARGRTVSFEVFDDYTELDARLPGADVLLVYPQRDSRGELQTIADVWHDALVAFAESGGVIVVLAGGFVAEGPYPNSGSAEHLLVSGEGLFTTPDGSIRSTGLPLPDFEAIAPDDPVAAGVVTYTTANPVDCFPGSSGGVAVIRTTASATMIPRLCPVVRHLAF